MNLIGEKAISLKPRLGDLEGNRDFSGTEGGLRAADHR